MRFARESQPPLDKPLLCAKKRLMSLSEDNRNDDNDDDDGDTCDNDDDKVVTQ